MADKIFFGNVKEMTNEYGTMYSIWIPKADLDKLVFNEKGWANVSMKKWRSGNWYMEVFVPGWAVAATQTTDNSQWEDEELPF